MSREEFSEELDLLIEDALQAHVGDLEPSPAVWGRIHRQARLFSLSQRYDDGWLGTLIYLSHPWIFAEGLLRSSGTKYRPVRWLPLLGIRAL